MIDQRCRHNNFGKVVVPAVPHPPAVCIGVLLVLKKLFAAAMLAGRSVARRPSRAVVAFASVLRVLLVLVWVVNHCLHLLATDQVGANAPHVGQSDQVARVLQNLVIVTSLVVLVYAPAARPRRAAQRLRRARPA